VHGKVNKPRNDSNKIDDALHKPTSVVAIPGVVGEAVTVAVVPVMPGVVRSE